MDNKKTVIVKKGKSKYTKERSIERIDDCFARYLLSLHGHEDILLSVVNSVMRNKGLQEFKYVEVKNPFNLKEQNIEQETIMDVKAVTNSNELVLLEMQVKGSIVFFDRVVDYIIRNGKITEKRDLPQNKIKKEKLLQVTPKQIISINFLGFKMYENTQLAHTTHMLHCCETKEKSSRKILMHMLELPKGVETIEDEELKLWFQFFYSENFEKDKKMLAEKTKVLKKAVEAYDSFVSNDDCMSYAEKHQLYKMYQEWETLAREERAHQQGIEQGVQLVAKNLKVMGEPLDKIIAITGLTENQIENL